MARTLWDALGEIEDGRGRKGRQYRLRSVLGIAIAAMLAGANDLRAIYRWGRRLRPEALPLFDITNGKAPCHATYHYFFQSLDADALARVLGSYAMARAPAGHIAIDGKTLSARVCDPCWLRCHRRVAPVGPGRSCSGSVRAPR